MRVLVTGGAGLIGSHLVEKLVSRGHEVTVLDNLSTGRIENLNHCPVEGRPRLVIGDIRDQNAVKDSIKNVDHVVHLAAITSVPYSIQNPVQIYDVNITGTVNVLKASADGGVEKFVFASSCAVYGEAKHLPVNEEHPLDALSPYAASKIAAEEECSTFRENYGLSTVCLRLFNVYGTKQRNNGNGGVIPHFVQTLEKSQPLTIYGDGEQTRDFIHVEDVVCAITRLLDDNYAEGVFNLGSGRPVTIRELASTLLEMSGRGQQKLLFGPPRQGEIRRSQADITKLQDQMEFRPSITLEEGLREAVRQMHAN